MVQAVSILMDAFFIGLLAWCSYSDIRKRTVSNITIGLLLCIGITRLGLMIYTQSTWWVYPLGMAFAIPFYISWLRGGMGAGDVKLVIAMTLYLGLLNAVIAFVLMIPVLVVLMIRLFIRKKTLKGRIPLAPVLAFGAICAVALGYLYALIQL